RLTGRITDASDPTCPLPNAFVSAYTAVGFQYVASGVAGSDGSYSLYLPTGNYIVFFGPPYLSDYLGEYWNDKRDQLSADPIDVTSSVAGINAVLARGVVISGHIRSATGATLAGSAFLADGNKPCCVFGVGHGTTSDGAYSFTVPPGNYFVGFYADGYKF